MKKENSRRRSDESRTSSAKKLIVPRATISERAFVKRVLDFSRREKLFGKNDAVLLALSGGPDSTALLYFFLSLRSAYGLTLSAAHVNYRLRGKDSDDDECFVQKLCKQHDIPLFIHHPRTKKTNEETLRTLRYAFLERIRVKYGINAIAVAHNRDDQAETFLLRLLRGSGAEGLRAMTPRRDAIIRPFLETSREDILRFLKENNIPFRIDRSNLEDIYLRNRIRNRLIPSLEKDFQPNIREILARTARLLAENTNTIRYDRGKWHTENIDTAPIIIEQVSFSRKAFLALPQEQQSDMLRMLYQKITNSPLNPPLAFIRECRKLLESKKSKPQELFHGRLKLEARGDRVVIIRNK